MRPQDLITKAEQAVKSSRLLYEADDFDGACHRAYYAMFDAAKAILLEKIPNTDSTIGKTHNGLITAFGLHIVKTGLIPLEYGRIFNRAYDLRQVADYTGDLIEEQEVKWLVE
jgi:uncharacterized protein (UPF0332 family)